MSSTAPRYGLRKFSHERVAHDKSYAHQVFASDRFGREKPSGGASLRGHSPPLQQSSASGINDDDVYDGASYSESAPYVAAEEVVVETSSQDPHIFAPEQDSGYEEVHLRNGEDREDGVPVKYARFNDNSRPLRSQPSEQAGHLVSGGAKTHPTISRPLVPAKVLMTEENLRPFPRLYAQQGRQRYTRKREHSAYPANDPPPELNIAADDGRTLAPSMTQVFRYYGRSTLKQATLSLENIDGEGSVVKSSSTAFEPVASVSQPSMRLLNFEQDEKHMDAKDVVERNSYEASEPPHLDNMVCEAEVESATRVQRLHSFGEWPIYWDRAIDFQEACDILTQQIYVEPSKICTSVPQNFRGEGTFIIDLTDFSNRHDVALDGLGMWGKPTGRTCYYAIDESGKPVRVDDGRGKISFGTHYDYKCMSKRYDHPGTLNRVSRFIKRVFTALYPHPRDSAVPLAIICYEWIGDPIDFCISTEQRNLPVRRNVTQPPLEGPKGWEASSFYTSHFDANQACNAFFDQWPLYAVGAVDFGTAACIVLGGTHIDISRICCRVPQGYRSAGTFVIDVRNFATDAELRRDANGAWGKPAGHSRYYKLDPTTGDAIRVDRGNKLLEGSDYDIQILSKRYEHTAVNGRFVRKIYTGRSRTGGRFAHCSNLAVITYYWKGEPEDFIATPQRKVRLGRIAPSERYRPPSLDEALIHEADERIGEAGPSNSESAFRVPHPRIHDMRSSSVAEDFKPDIEPSLRKLQLSAYRKQYENQMRFSALLDRAEIFLERLERLGDALTEQVWFTGGQGGEVIHGEEMIPEAVVNDGEEEQYVEEIYDEGER